MVCVCAGEAGRWLRYLKKPLVLLVGLVGGWCGGGCWLVVCLHWLVVARCCVLVWFVYLLAVLFVVLFVSHVWTACCLVCFPIFSFAKCCESP